MAQDVNVDSLPLLDIDGDIDRRDLYTTIMGDTCRRCKGTGADPDGLYPCLLCHGKKIENWLTGSIKVCSSHPDAELVCIGKRRVTWEDGQGFDRSGFLGVLGCPICKVPARSVLNF